LRDSIFRPFLASLDFMLINRNSPLLSSIRQFFFPSPFFLFSCQVLFPVRPLIPLFGFPDLHPPRSYSSLSSLPLPPLPFFCCHPFSSLCSLSSPHPISASVDFVAGLLTAPAPPPYPSLAGFRPPPTSAPLILCLVHDVLISHNPVVRSLR